MTLVTTTFALITGLINGLIFHEVRSDCSHPVDGGIGDPPFCKAVTAQHINHLDFSVVVPTGWVYGKTPSSLRIQNAPIGEMAIVMITQIKKTESLSHLKEYDSGCEMIQNDDGHLVCDRSSNGITHVIRSIAHDDYIIQLTLEYPDRFSDYFDDTLSELEKSLITINPES